MCDQAVSCRHCGLPVPRARRGDGEEVAFCCYGCRIASAIPESVTSIASRSARREEADRLEAALDAIPTAQREIVQFYYLEGLSLSELAQKTGRARSSLWDELKQALGKLREVLPE